MSESNFLDRGGKDLDIDLIFKIAAIGIMVSVLNILLNKSGREEYAMMITIAGLIIVLLVIVREIADLFQTVKTIFRF
jgi:stage III sporulation protein AC